MERAEELGVDVSTRLASMTFDVRDLWKLYRYVKPIKRNEMHKAKSTSNISDINQGIEPSDEDGKHLLDVKSDILHTLNLIADFHERVAKSAQLIVVRSYADCSLPIAYLSGEIPIHLDYVVARSSLSSFSLILCQLNIFPSSCISFSVLYFGMLYQSSRRCLPRIGLGLWLINLQIFFRVLTSTRLPVPLASVPTDAEFAMQLISKRVADGNELRPTPTSRRSFERSERGMHAGTSNDVQQTDIGNRIQTDNRIDWNKWGSRIATGKTWIHRKKQVITAKEVLFWCCDYREVCA